MYLDDKAIEDLTQLIDNMTDEEYDVLLNSSRKDYKEFEEEIDKITDCEEEDYWNDNFDIKIGCIRCFQYQIPFFPFLSVEIVRREGKIEVISLGIFKNKFYITLDLD